MELLVILLCLLSERFLIHTRAHKRFNWFKSYTVRMEKLIERQGIKSPWLMLAVIILPIVIPVALIYLLVHNLFFGLFAFVFGMLLLLYCLGPENVFYPASDEEPNNSDFGIIGAYLIRSNRELFSVLFWFIAVGPITALIYRLITLCCTLNVVHLQAQQLTNILEWVPARISALLFLLVGNFQRGFDAYKKAFLKAPAFNAELLSSCGLLALDSEESKEIPMPIAEQLVEHATVVFVVLIALFYLVAY